MLSPGGNDDEDTFNIAVTDPPPSRAGSLPQWMCVGRADLRTTINSLWERACREDGSPFNITVLPPVIASRLAPHFLAVYSGWDDVIHCAVHGQFREHDDLLDRQRRTALRATQPARPDRRPGHWRKPEIRRRGPAGFRCRCSGGSGTSCWGGGACPVELGARGRSRGRA